MDFYKYIFSNLLLVKGTFLNLIGTSGLSLNSYIGPYISIFSSFKVSTCIKALSLLFISSESNLKTTGDTQYLWPNLRAFPNPTFLSILIVL